MIKRDVITLTNIHESDGIGPPIFRIISYAFAVKALQTLNS